MVCLACTQKPPLGAQWLSSRVLFFIIANIHKIYIVTMPITHPYSEHSHPTGLHGTNFKVR